MRLPACGKTAVICRTSARQDVLGTEADDTMEKPVLVDTDVMVDFLRGNPKAVALVWELSAWIILPSIVAAELYAGVKGSKNGILDMNYFGITDSIFKTTNFCT